MIPILFDKYETSFDHNGLGRLSDCISCTVTEELNGEYTLEMQYPTDGNHFDEIEVDSIIGAYASDGENMQLFLVSQIDTTMKIATIQGNHISYRLSGIPVRTFSNKTTLNAALNAIQENAVTNDSWDNLGFTISTDMTVTGKKWSFDNPQSVMKCLGEVIETFGGDLYRDNFDIQILSERGEDKGVSIRYGKNMTEVDIQHTSAANGYYYYYNSNGISRNPWSAGESNEAHPYPFFEIKDATIFYDETPTNATLVAAAQSASQNLEFPKISIDVSFVELGKFPEYEDLAILESTNMGDTVHVYHEGLGLDYTARVKKTVFNVLTENYDSISIGTVQESLADTIANELNVSESGGSNLLYAQATGTASSSTAGTSTTQVPLTTFTQNNSDVFSISDGGIKVSKAGVYRITASAQITPGSASTLIGVYVRSGTSFSGGDEPLSHLEYAGATTRRAINEGPKIVSLSADDIVYLGVRSNSAAGTCVPNHDSTYLLVEKIS